MLSWEWRCSNYIWVINDLTAYWSASYIRDLTVLYFTPHIPRQQSSLDQHGAHMSLVGPRWAPCWPHEPCYQGCYNLMAMRHLQGTYDYNSLNEYVPLPSSDFSNASVHPNDKFCMIVLYQKIFLYHPCRKTWIVVLRKRWDEYVWWCHYWPATAILHIKNSLDMLTIGADEICNDLKCLFW